jgi:phosphoribosylformylglycinamidine synthase
LAEGGLLIALAECAIGGAKHLGAAVKLDLPYKRLDALLFGESQSRAIVTTRPENATALVALIELRGVPARRIGTVDGVVLTVQISGPTPREFKWDVAELYQAWDGSLDLYLT